MTLKQLTICTLKKSASIFGEIGAGILLFGSTIFASAISGLVLAYIVREVVNLSRAVVSVLANPVSVIIEFVTNIAGAIASFFTISLFGIPLWAILLVPVAIVVYSFLWCVNRELTEEDYAWAKSYHESTLITPDRLAVFVVAFVTYISPIQSSLWKMTFYKTDVTYGASLVFGCAFSALIACVIVCLYSIVCIPMEGKRFDYAVYHHYFKVKK